MTDADDSTLKAVEKHFHALIRSRAAELVDEHQLELPGLHRALAFEEDSDRAWFPVPGMYGGFAYAWDPEHIGTRLLVESWCRVVGGSGQSHAVTASGYELLDEGFV